jgi:hypothetical protein
LDTLSDDYLGVDPSWKRVSVYVGCWDGEPSSLDGVGVDDRELGLCSIKCCSLGYLYPKSLSMDTCYQAIERENKGLDIG